jgi:hypothetical protein
MAQKRMFSLEIVDTDAFLEMPASSQALYFHLSMRADDDGFVSNPKKIIKMLGSNDDDLKILLTKRFILSFDDGIIVIKHWRINNYIQSDRYKPTKYIEQKNQLTLKENGSYTECIQNVYELDTQIRLDKIRLDENSIERTPTQIMQEFISNDEVKNKLKEELSKKYNCDINFIGNEINKFIAYWTEPNKSGTKQRWEMEKTFELTRRLATWLNNIEKFNKSTNKPKTIIL